MSKKHIRESNKGLRHVSRHTEPCNHSPSKNCNYEKMHAGAFAPPETFPKHGYPRHHVLPVSSIGKFEILDSYTGQQRQKILGVYRETKWCSSRETNIIALPVKTTYRRNPKARTLDRPCHDVDHGCALGYTDEVTASVERRVWKKFQKAASGGGHPQPDEVTEALNDLEKDFRKKLADRGRRKGGTSAAFDALRSSTPGNIRKKMSWLPFSMAKDSIAKQRVLLSLSETPQWLHEKLTSRYARR